MHGGSVWDLWFIDCCLACFHGAFSLSLMFQTEEANKVAESSSLCVERYSVLLFLAAVSVLGCHIIHLFQY